MKNVLIYDFSFNGLLEYFHLQSSQSVPDLFSRSSRVDWLKHPLYSSWVNKSFSLYSSVKKCNIFSSKILFQQVLFSVILTSPSEENENYESRLL